MQETEKEQQKPINQEQENTPQQQKIHQQTKIKQYNETYWGRIGIVKKEKQTHTGYAKYRVA